MSSFQDFSERWLAEQNLHLRDLISVAESQPAPEYSLLRGMTGRVMEHYEAYYRVKSAWAHRDVLTVLSPSWRTSLEEALLWIGGWRPSMAFHLLYSKSGLQLEAHIDGPARKDNVAADLAGLSAVQFRRIDELHVETIKEERRLTEKMAKVQESVADVTMVDLSHAASEMMRRTSDGDDDDDEVEMEMEDDRVEEALEPKKRKMEELLLKADNLRLTTLRTIVDEVLTPMQGVHFLIAVAELHLRVHDWGKRRDDDSRC